MLCRLGPITRSKGIGFPIFSHISPILIDLRLFYPHFSSFCTMYPTFGSFYASIFFIDLQLVAYFIFRAACGTPVMLLSLRGSGFGTQLPPKIGSPAKTFLLALSLNSPCLKSLRIEAWIAL